MDIRCGGRTCGAVENKVSNKHKQTLKLFCGHVCNKKDQFCYTQIWIYTFSKAIRIIGITGCLIFWLSSCFMKPVKMYHENSGVSWAWDNILGFLYPPRHNCFTGLDLIVEYKE